MTAIRKRPSAAAHDGSARPPTVLAAYEPTPSGDDTIALAALLARSAHGRLLAAQIVSPDLFAPDELDTGTDWNRLRRERVRTALAATLDAHAEGLATRPKALLLPARGWRGPREPATALIGLGAREQADLLVMPATQGADPLVPLPGEMGLALLRMGRTPVAFAPVGFAERAGALDAPHVVGVVTDLGRRHDRIVEAASAIARLLGAELQGSSEGLTVPDLVVAGPDAIQSSERVRIARAYRRTAAAGTPLVLVPPGPNTPSAAPSEPATKSSRAAPVRAGQSS